MRLARVLVAAAVVFGTTVGGIGPAVAAGPTIERITVDDTFVDRFLSQECGVRVVTRAVGRFTVKTWDREGTGPLAMTNINITLTATAGGNSFRFKDVGADLLRRQPDGRVVLKIAGQVPFAFKGVLKIDLDTGEVLHEPRRSVGTERACAALTA